MRAPSLSLPPEPERIAGVLKTWKASAPERPCRTGLFTVPSITTSRTLSQIVSRTERRSKRWATCLPARTAPCSSPPEPEWDALLRGGPQRITISTSTTQSLVKPQKKQELPPQNV